MTTNEDRSSEQIKETIEDTRERMDYTIDRLTEKLDPKAVWNGIVGIFGSHDGGDNSGHTGTRDFLKSIARPIRGNPMAALALGASAVWLIASAMGDDDDEHESGSYDKARDAASSVKGKATDAGHTLADKASSMAASVSGAGKSLAEKATAVKSSVAAGLESAKGGIADGIEHARGIAIDQLEHARDAARQVVKSSKKKGAHLYAQVSEQISDAVSSTQNRYHDGLRENPLGLLVGALAVGLLAGVAVPVTRKEDELFGDYSDKITDGIKETGKEILEKSKVVGERVAQKALDEVEGASVDTGRLSDVISDVKGSVVAAAKSVKGEVENAMHDEGLTKANLSQKAGLDQPKKPDFQP